MALYKTHNDLLINPNYIIMIGPILYNNTAEEYYFRIYLNGNDITDINLSFKTEDEANKERNRLTSACGGIK